MSKRKFFVKLSSGDKFQISELDFIHLDSRRAQGRTNGFYKQRGESFDRHNWTIQFKDLVTWWADSPEKKNIEIRNIDIQKRKPPKVGKLPKEEPKKNCHDWNKPETWTHVTTIVSGINRYFKQCNECGKKSKLIKKREVEVAQEAKGATIDDVELVS